MKPKTSGKFGAFGALTVAAAVVILAACAHPSPAVADQPQMHEALQALVGTRKKAKGRSRSGKKPASTVQELQTHIAKVRAEHPYASAHELKAQGTHLVSTDEKTGRQALERTAPMRPIKPGSVEDQEFE